MPEEKETEGPKPVVTEEEIERIIKELEKREEERRRAFEEERKRLEAERRRLEAEKAKKIEPIAPPPKVAPPPEIPPPQVPKPPIPPPLAPKPEIPKPKKPIVIFFKYFFLFILLVVLFHLGLNYYSFFLQAKYTYKINIKKQSPPSSFNLPVVPETNEINLSDSLIIPKIQVDAPIIWQVEIENIIKEAQNGVVHLKGSALPTEEGKIILFGHSSSYPWQKTQYGKVFALLDRLKPEDQIAIVYQKKKYLFKVTKKSIVSPEDVKVLTDQEPGLILITCWPIGTSLKRLVIFASEIEKPTESVSELFLPILP